MKVRAGTRTSAAPDTEVVGYLEQEVMDMAVDGSPDDLLDAIALVARYLDEQAGAAPCVGRCENQDNRPKILRCRPECIAAADLLSVVALAARETPVS